MNRHLDGYYFRIKRDGRWENICFSDLTEEEMQEVLNGKDTLWLKSLCAGLAHTLKGIGEQFDISGV